jgi:hypothetical protein
MHGVVGHDRKPEESEIKPRRTVLNLNDGQEVGSIRGAPASLHRTEHTQHPDTTSERDAGAAEPHARPEMPQARPLFPFPDSSKKLQSVCYCG